MSRAVGGRNETMDYFIWFHHNYINFSPAQHEVHQEACIYYLIRIPKWGCSPNAFRTMFKTFAQKWGCPVQICWFWKATRVKVWIPVKFCTPLLLTTNPGKGNQLKAPYARKTSPRESFGAGKLAPAPTYFAILHWSQQSGDCWDSPRLPPWP